MEEKKAEIKIVKVKAKNEEEAVKKLLKSIMDEDPDDEGGPTKNEVAEHYGMSSKEFYKKIGEIHGMMRYSELKTEVIDAMFPKLNAEQRATVYAYALAFKDYVKLAKGNVTDALF